MPISAIEEDLVNPGIVDLDERPTYDQSPHTLHTRSVWEFFIRLGRSPSIEGTDANCVESLIRNEEMIIANDSLNFCAADDTGTFLYWLGAYVPRQGLDLEDSNMVGIRPWLFPDRDIQVFDGTLRRRYWRGLLPLGSLPNVVQSASEQADKIWIQNNATENHISRYAAPRDQLITLTSFPDYVTDHGNAGLGWGDRRQFDVEDLLHANAPITQEKNRDLALTKRDPWSIMYWPYFEEVIEQEGSSDAVAFAEFIDMWKNEEEDGTSRGGPEFIAHTASRTMPYLTLLQSYYEGFVTAAFPVDFPADDVELIFALDPYATKPAPAVLVASLDYALTVDYMLDALDRVVSIWRRSGAAGGLCNHIVLMTDELDSITPGNINEIMQGDPFVTEQPWRAGIYDDDVLRWGHCQTLVATHHAFQGTGGFFVDRLEPWRRSFYTSFWPERLQDISSYEFKDHSHFTASRVAVWPIGGVNESVFASAARNGAYVNSLAGIEAGTLTTARLYYLRIFSAGGPVILSVDLGPQDGETANVGYYRALFGATEISADLSTWYAGQHRDDYYAAGGDYVDGTWTPLNVTKNSISEGLRHQLVYTP